MHFREGPHFLHGAQLKTRLFLLVRNLNSMNLKVTKFMGSIDTWNKDTDIDLNWI